MSEIAEAISILGTGTNVIVQAAGLTFKVAAGGLNVAKSLALFMMRQQQERAQASGEIRFNKMLQKENSQVLVVQYAETDEKRMREALEAYGLRWSKMPDLNLQDGKKEILVPAEQQTLLAAMMQRYHVGQLITMEDYMKGASVEECTKQAAEYDEMVKDVRKQGIKIADKEKHEDLGNMTVYQMYQEEMENDSLHHIVFSQEQIFPETPAAKDGEEAIKDKAWYIRIPGQEDTIKLNPEQIYAAKGKYEAFLDEDVTYSLYDKDGKTKGQAYANQISSYFDKAEEPKKAAPNKAAPGEGAPDKDKPYPLYFNKDKLLIREDDEDVLLRIPGATEDCLLIRRADLTDKDTSYLVKVRSNEHYQIADKEGNPVRLTEGQQLIEQFKRLKEQAKIRKQQTKKGPTM